MGEPISQLKDLFAVGCPATNIRSGVLIDIRSQGWQVRGLSIPALASRSLWIEDTPSLSSSESRPNIQTSTWILDSTGLSNHLQTAIGNTWRRRKDEGGLELIKRGDNALMSRPERYRAVSVAPTGHSKMLQSKTRAASEARRYLCVQETRPGLLEVEVTAASGTDPLLRGEVLSHLP